MKDLIRGGGNDLDDVDGTWMTASDVRRIPILFKNKEIENRMAMARPNIL